MTHKRSIWCGIACGLLAITSTTTCLGAGVTVITHGWNSEADSTSWLNTMVNAVAKRGGGLSQVARYTLVIGNGFGLGPLSI